MSYTVPKGYLAWDVGGGGDGPTGCTDKTPPPGLTAGFDAWGVKGSATSGGGGTGGAGNRIHVQGPTHIAYHHSFVQVITGTATGAANYVQSGEQLGSARCASTLVAEQARSELTLWPSGSGPVHGSFHLVARFYARNRLQHAICSYLINRATKQTFAHTGNYWSNA